MGSGLLAVAIAFSASLGCSAASTPEFAVRDTGVVVRSTAAFTRHADFPVRIESTIDAALTYWGGNWDQLAGKMIIFEGAQHVACTGVEGAIGCYDGNVHVSTQDAGLTLRCVEETVLVHEIGHAVIGDPDHRDPRWMDFSALTADLSGRPGYGEDGDGTCPIFVSMWRHPPRT